MLRSFRRSSLSYACIPMMLIVITNETSIKATRLLRSSLLWLWLHLKNAKIRFILSIPGEHLTFRPRPIPTFAIFINSKRQLLRRQEYIRVTLFSYNAKYKLGIYDAENSRTASLNPKLTGSDENECIPSVLKLIIAFTRFISSINLTTSNKQQHKVFMLLLVWLILIWLLCSKTEKAFLFC